MCGIAGILRMEGRSPPSREALRAMASRLRHRGPEGEGYRLDDRAGLAHTRLSIIDVEGGAQPITNENDGVWVVLNGEIFNYVELRSELKRKGHRFRTRTDTEVIVHLYEEMGDAFVDRLNGQFAIALWDSERKRLVLARDRVGIVPLFLADSERQLVFASEVKALLPVLGKPELDPVALDQVMTFWAPVSPRTLFRGIRELPPGHVLVADSRGVKTRRYWDWTFPTSREEYHSGSESALADELLGLLADATRIRLRSDVPVGAYLSGGLDSSTLVSLMDELRETDLRTFSVRFEREDLDESPFQRMMIQRIGADHSGILCSRQDLAHHFPDTVLHTETPVLRTAPTPMKLLSGLVRDRGYKVVLTGEGSDEVLGGYDLFKEAKVRRFWSRRPDSSWRPLLLRRLYPYLDFSALRAQGYLRAFFGAGLDDPESILFAHLPRWVTASRGKAFFSESLSAKLEESALDTISATIPEEAGRWDPFNQAQYIEAKSLLSGYLLSSQGDRMLMANSVEGRFPFLDHRVIEFSSRLDPRLKMRVLREKHLLKRAMEGRLPKEILQREKNPYRGPDSEAFYTDGKAHASYLDELLDPATVERYGYFEAKKVEMLREKARWGSARGVGDNQAFMGILSTQLWHYLFIDRYDSEPSGDLQIP